jgi:hypothetical protein
MIGVLSAPTPAYEQSIDAAVEVIRRYYDAVARRDFRAAHAIWSGGRSLKELRAGYADTAAVAVTPVPPFEADGGAGSIFAKIPVRIDSRLRDGTRQRFAGVYYLRRVNDVDGASRQQRRWHIERASLKRVY